MRRLWHVAAGLVLVLLLSGVAVQPAAAQPLAQGERPFLPDDFSVGTENFLIHYTLSGASAVDPTDADGSGVPDYVERVAETVEHVWQVQITEMGWPPPASDGGLGGDERMDVYLDDILAEGYAGYVDTAGGYIGDNPLTPQVERRAAFVYMVLDNDYAEVDVNAGETPLGLMQATVAHEFNHALQAGIDDRNLHAWLYEAAATWMEDEVYDDINDGVFYLLSVYDNTDICLVAETARGDDLHWYGTWLLLRLMSERYGQDIVLTIWENMREVGGFRAIDLALAPHGSSLLAESRDFAVANLLRAYTEGDLYPTVRVEGEAGVGVYRPADGVQSLGADYVRLNGSGPLTVTLTSPEAPLSLRAVGVRGGDADLIEMAGNSLTVDRSLYSDVFLIVHNDDQFAHESECFFADYTLEVTEGSAPSSVASVWPAGLFSTPSGTAVADSSQAGSTTYRPPDAPFQENTDSYSVSPQDLNMSFETLVPEAPPPGYTFDFGYIMTEEDFGDSAPYYVPGGGDTANFDYLDEHGNWLSIAESPSPYNTLDEWLTDIDYYDTPGEIRSISGVEVLVEDLSDTSDVWISATLILQDLFIVVDGDNSEQDVLILVEELVDAAGLAMPQTNPAAGATQPAPAVTAPSAAQNPTAGPDSPETGVDVTEEGWLGAVLGSLVGAGILALCCLALLVPLVILGVVLILRRNKA